MAAYAHHARRLGKTDENVSAFIEEALFATVTNVNFDIGNLFEMVLECGRQNIRVSTRNSKSNYTFGVAIRDVQLFVLRWAEERSFGLHQYRPCPAQQALLHGAAWRRFLPVCYA